MKAAQQRIARTHPAEVGRVIRALNERSPLTWGELRDVTMIKPQLLRHVLEQLEAEETIGRGYPEDPRESIAARYWLTWDPPGVPASLEYSGQDEEDDGFNANEVDEMNRPEEVSLDRAATGGAKE